MYRLDFSDTYDYSGDGEGLMVPVILRVGTRQTRFVAAVDTGASFCVFSTGIASRLGLDLESGIPSRFRTANSGFDAYGHEVEIVVPGASTHSMVYFFANEAIEKNVLGRTGWLDRVSVGLVHYESRIYIGTYDLV